MTREIKKILVLGVGVMGNGIVHIAAQAGYQVNVFDITQDFVDKGLGIIRKNFDGTVKRGKLSQDDADEAFARITGFVNLEQAAKDVDFVIEAVIENIKIKIDLYTKLNGWLAEDVIFASNTSTLSVSMLGGGSGRGDRFVGMHFFNPAHKMKLCELIRGISTSDETLEVAKELGTKLGKEIIVAKDSPGFIVNRILLPLLNEAVFALDEGVGSVEDIDKGVKLGLGHPLGPLELLDLIGLDTATHVATAFYDEFKDSKYRVPPLMRKMVAAGRLGRKSGWGFYKY